MPDPAHRTNQLDPVMSTWYHPLACLVLWSMFGPVAFAQPAPQAFTSPSEEMNGAFGAAVGGLADINDDGIADVVIGAPNESGFF